MTKICYLCKKGEIIHDKKMSGMFCTGCGECFELGAFTDEVQYREDERGRYKAVGTTYNVEKGFVNSKFTNHAQYIGSVDNAKQILKRYCDKLYISESFSQISSGFYHQLLIKKFMNGRRLNTVLAACLYIAVRSEGANVILLDISDVSEANVYDIGRYYFQIIRILHFNIQTVDPCEYIVRFVDMLNLGDRNLSQVKRTALCIRDTANRLVQRMKRDWIHFGRRPSGVCAAAVLVSARINNVRCSIKDIISIAKVCESTIRKRINEFIQTPSSQLTYKEFMSKDLETEEDPPSFKFSNSIKDTVEANLAKVEKYHEIIEEHLKDSRTKLRGVYAKFLKNISETSLEEENNNNKLKSDDENSLIQETIIEQNILIHNKIIKNSNESNKFSIDNGNPTTEEMQYWLEWRPTAESLGFLKKETNSQTENNNNNQIDYEDLLDTKLDNLDDEEIDAYLIDDPIEIGQRSLEWNSLNKDYLEKEEKQSLKRLQEQQQQDDDDDTKSINSKISYKNRKKRKRIEQIDKIEASSTSEAVEQAIKSQSKSLNLNLKELFNETTATTSSSLSSNTTIIDNQDSINNLETIVNSNNNDNKSSTNNITYIDEDANLVSLYHSYASKIPISNDDNNDDDGNKTNEIKIKDSLDTTFENDDNNDNDNEEEEEHIINNNKNNNNIIDDDDDVDDYFDDEDDELRKIKLKYSIQNEFIDDRLNDDDIEDCGF